MTRTPDNVDQRATGRLTGFWARIAPYMGESKGAVAVLVALSLVSGFVEAGLIFFIVRIAAALTKGNAKLDLPAGPLGALTVKTSLILAAAALVMMFILNSATVLLTARISVNALNRIRKRMLDAFIGSSWAVQSRETPSRMQELLSAHVERIAQAIFITGLGLGAALSFVALMVSAIVIQPFAAALIFLGVISMAVLLRPLTRMTKQRSSYQRVRNLGYAERVAELVTVVREINVFGVTQRARDDLNRQSDNIARASFITRVLVRTYPLVYQTAVIGLLLAGMAGVYLTKSQSITNLGAVVLLLVRALSYSQQINGAVQLASEISPYVEDLQVQEAFYRANPVQSGVRALPEVVDLRLDEVSFEYEPGHPVLRGISFGARPGHVIGIVGPTGSGKSTLIQVILRLHQPSGGRYLVNGEEVTDYQSADWTSRFALVPQDNHLVRGSVYDNVRFFRPHLTDDEIVRAAVRARIHDEIEAMPHGYDTEIGGSAQDLSGGQRQRLGLARALVGDPQVLILDEPTSALDMRSEALVQETLGDLEANVLTLVVAHRLTTLSICDRILVLDGGRIAASGSFAELQQTNEFFRHVVELSKLPAGRSRRPAAQLRAR